MKKPARRFARWTAYIYRGERLAWIGAVEARNEEEARKKIAEQYDIKSADRFRISVKRE